MHVSPSRLPLVVENFQETAISSGWPWPWRFGERAGQTFSETNHACSENTEIHSENEGNNGVELVSGPNKCKTVLGRNTETWKMRNPCDVTGELSSDEIGGG